MRFLLLLSLLCLVRVTAADSQLVFTFHKVKADMSLPPLPNFNLALEKVRAPVLAAGQLQQVFIRTGPSQPQSTPALPTVPDPPVLRWKNGESIQGDAVEATSTSVTWKTPLFEDPLQLEWSALDRIDCPQASVPAADPFSFSLRDGSFIYGDLVSIGADSISIHSSRHGDAALQRSQVLNVRRLHGKSLLFSGPTGDVGWQGMSNQQDGNVSRNQGPPDATSPLASGPDGVLEIRSWNRSAFLDLQLPDVVEVDFHVHSSKRPEFAVALGESPRVTLRVETWGNELVLAMGDEFKILTKIEDNARDVGLSICWDKKAQKCAVFSAAGELIADWHVPQDVSSAPGLVLQNKGLDLTLDSLRVRTWDGKPPAKIDPKQTRIDTADGRTLGGEVVAGAPGSIKLQSPGQTAPTDIAISNIDSLVLSTDSPKAADHEATLLYADGTMLFGKLESISNGRAAVTTSFTSAPLLSQMKQLRKMVVNVSTPKGVPPEPPLENQDKILIQDTTLHGKISTAGDDWPRWTPVGGVKASRPSKTVPNEITRAFPGDAPLPSDPALFYLSSGDVLPGTLRSLDRSGAEFESDIMDARKLVAADLDAIQFAPPTRINVQGFGDPSWHIVKGDDKSVRRKGDTLEMDPGTVISQPSLMQSSEISFKYASNGFSACRLRMFCAGSDATRSMSLLVGNTGGEFIAGLEASEGQFANQFQMRIQPGQPAVVRLAINERKIELFINDLSVMQFPVDPAKSSGSGLMLEPAGMWGNGPFPVSLSTFSAKSSPGRTWLPEVTSEIKSQVLTVPRFQKDDPPRHLLLASNGDVLRGEIEAATDTHFGFRCGMENLNVPRDRVKAVIWLKQPDKESSDAPPPVALTPSVLDQRLAGRMMFARAGLHQLISFIQSQVQGLKFQFPAKEDTRRIQMMFASQTVAEALAIICSQFDLHYHLNNDGVVVLESASSPAPTVEGFARKAYWLKPGAFPQQASVQEILTAKGVPFPANSSVEWQPKTNLLTMTNTPDNQARLEGILNSDFGGSMGSPTHWLLLTSGGRLALAVDKFDSDFVTGHNPAYGSCKVPMSQVFAIRTSAPEPTITSKALADWHLVNAPEPVLPVSGGESSPLLGKDAFAFKLPLLDGGDFDLEAQKGQVIILDFWATWCGPCVKSLPGLIDTVASFPADKVKLIGVNQGESSDQVKRFLEARNLKLSVAMDSDQGVGRKYGVDAIPHTIIIGPDGKVALVQTGYSPDGDTEASDTLKRLLQPPSPATAPDKGVTQ